VLPAKHTGAENAAIDGQESHFARILPVPAPHPDTQTELGMKTWMLAGAIALATVGPVWVDRDGAYAASLESGKITDVNIAQIKNALKLTAAQEPLWVRVEEVLRSIAREQTQAESAGLLRRISHRVVSIVFDEPTVERLKNAAMPLLASLDEEQKIAARRVARQMGLADMVAMSN
jgi:hypothetical protein